MRGLALRTGFHTLDRWLYNAGVALRPPARADLVVGYDLDGFLWARRRRGAPFVATLKGIIAQELLNERGWVRVLLGVQARWERRNAVRADLVSVPSLDSAQVAARAYGVPRARLVVVPETIDLEAWQAELAAARASVPTVSAAARAPAAPSGPVILSVARMYPRKRIADLLRAAAALRRDVPAARVRVVGRGPEWELARRLHAELALGETVALLGDVSREQLAAEYARADLFYLASVQEGFGIVFLEAMAAGLPIVACRVSAIPETVADGVVGVLVPPGEPEAAAAALAALARDPARRRALGDAGRERVRDYALDRVAATFLRAVQSLIDAS